MKRSFHSLCFEAALVASALLSGRSLAQEPVPPVDHAGSLAPFLSDDTFAVAFVDLTKIDPPALMSQVLGPVELSDQDKQAAARAMTPIKAVLDGARGAGVRHLFVIMGIGDLHPRGGPVAVFPIADRDAQTRVTEQIQAGVQMAQSIAGGRAPDVRIERHASGALLVGSQSAIDRYSLLLSVERLDLTGPLARLAADGPAVAVVFAPGADSRRVIRELWPELPPPASALNRELLADRTRHAELSIKLPPNLAAHAAVETADAEATAAYRQLLTAASQELSRENRNEFARFLRAMLDSLDVQAEGPRLTVRLPTEGAALASLRDALSRGIAAARQDGMRQRRMNDFRQLMIGMLNYESRNRHLPPAAIRDADGRPLLSWRVAILPYLGQEALYSQFRLNEPWNSPHNITLLRRMPDVFADPDPKLAALALEGKTTFQVPVGPQTIFFKNEGTRYGEVTDGAARTIAVVEVAPERAVEWTKPADWEVNMQDPLAGVRRSDREGFVAARGDGSVAFYSNDTDAADWRALLTRAARDVAPR